MQNPKSNHAPPSSPKQPDNSLMILLVVLILLVLGLGAVALYIMALREPQIIASDPFLFYSGIICVSSLSLPFLISGVVRWSRQRKLGSGIWVLFFLGSLPLFASAHLYFTLTNYKANCTNRIEAGADLRGCEITEMNLTDKDLSNTNIELASLNDVDLTRVKMSQTNFKDAILQKTKFNNANLTSISFVEAILTDVDFSDAILSQIDLTKAKLTNVNFSDATLDQINLTNAQIDRVDLEGASLTNLILEYTILREVMGVTDLQWAKALSVPVNELSAALNQRHTSLEDLDSIVKGLIGICKGKAIVNAGVYSSTNSFHAIVVMNTGDGALISGGDLQQWQPAAIRFADFVACVQDEQENSAIQTCQYTGGPAITRYQYHVGVQVFDTSSGQAVAENTIYGKPADPCPETARVSETRIDGEKVSSADLSAWLKQFVNPPE